MPVRWWMMPLSLLAVMILCGCDRLQQEVARLQPPPAVAPQPTPPAPVAVAPPPAVANVVEKPAAPLPPPPPTPEEILKKFLSALGPERNEKRLAEIAALELTWTNFPELDLSSSPLTIGGLASLGRMQDLTWLRLSVTPLKDEDLTGLPPLVKLRTLLLDNTHLRGPGLQELTRFPSLRELHLQKTMLTDQELARLAALPQLEVLHLDNNRELQGLEFGKLIKARKLPALTELTMDFTKMGTYGVQSLSALKNLEVFSGHTCHLRDEGLDELSRCPKLRKLVIAFTPVTNLGLKSLVGSNALEELDLSGCQFVTNEGLNFISKLPQLKRLDLTDTSVSADAALLLKQKFLKNTVVVHAQQEL